MESTIAVLTEYAKEKHRSIVSSETPYFGSIIHPVTYHKRWFYMPFDSSNNCFLIGYSDPKSFGENSMFFGVFSLAQTSMDNRFCIRKKFVFDRFREIFNKPNSIT